MQLIAIAVESFYSQGKETRHINGGKPSIKRREKEASLYGRRYPMKHIVSKIIFKIGENHAMGIEEKLLVKKNW